MVTIEFNSEIKAIQLTSSNIGEVIEILKENNIPCSRASNGIAIESTRRNWESTYRIACKGDYLVIFPYVNEFIINCWIVPESDFERRFTICK